MDKKPITLAVYINRPTEKWLLDEDHNSLDAINVFQAQKHWMDLKKLLEKNNSVLVTWLDAIKRDLKPDYVLFVDIPLIPIFLIKWLSTNQFTPILFLSEPPSIRFWCYWKIFQSQFNLVFDWSSCKSESGRRVRLPHPASFDFENKKTFNFERKSKFATMITANKPSNHKKSLQKNREHVINWFNNNHPGKFDLFGAKWDVKVSKYKIIRFIYNKLKLKNKSFNSVNQVYQGKVKDKWETMSEYKFVFTFENSEYPNLITEKIFDAIFAGSVPIYLGAPNITNYINSSLFIDYRNFENMEELYEYLKNMSKEEYLTYLEAGELFFNSQEYYKFSSANFSNVIFRRLKMLNE